MSPTANKYKTTSFSFFDCFHLYGMTEEIDDLLRDIFLGKNEEFFLLVYKNVFCWDDMSHFRRKEYVFSSMKTASMLTDEIKN